MERNIGWLKDISQMKVVKNKNNNKLRITKAKFKAEGISNAKTNHHNKNNIMKSYICSL